MTVTDELEQSANGNINVSIEDDGPVLSGVVADDAEIEDNVQSITGTLADLSIGADSVGATIVVEVNGTVFTGTKGENDWSFASDNAKDGEGFALDEHGRFTYTRPTADLSDKDNESYTINVTVTDGDGDSVSKEVTVTAFAKPEIVPTDPETPEGVADRLVTDDSGLSDGNKEDPSGETGSASKATDSGSFSVQLNGQGYTLVIEGKEEDSSLTLKFDAEGNLIGELPTTSVVGEYGNLSIDRVSAENGKLTVEYTYTQTSPVTHEPDTGMDQVATDADGFAVTVTDELEQSASGSIKVSIEDDGPVIKASSVSTSLNPADSNNLQRVDEVISFAKDKEGNAIPSSNEVQEDWWGNTVHISATNVSYNGTDQWNNPLIDSYDDTDMSLGYSKYNDKLHQSYKDNNPPTEDIKLGIAKLDVNGNWYREAPYTDWGLTVNGGANDWEIQASGNTSEAVVITLDGLAYGFTVNFGAFFAGKEENSDKIYGTGYDSKSEKALIAFYKGDQLVYSHVAEGSASGEFVYNSGEVILGGFNRVVISAVDNTENSDFTIQGFDFVTKRDEPIIVNGGTVTAESGADGFAEEYQESNVKFDLGSMVQEGTLNDKGTSGTITVLIKGEPLEVTLELSEGSSGESILTGTIKGTNEQLFTATLDKDGNWTMEQYEHFRVPGEGEQSSNEFELVFKTEDSDGDIATTKVNVPLEVKEQSTNDAGKSIGNSDDTISITSSVDDGVAGTVVAGDTGGMTEGQQVEANYNVCFILDTSGSMEDKVGEKPSHGKDPRPTRLDIAVESIQNFVESSIHNGDFVGTVNLSVVTFASSYGQTIEVSITRELNEQGGYTETYTFNGSSSTYEEFKDSFQSSLTKLNASGGTNYETGFRHAAEWFEELDTSNSDGNITYFLTDGVPTYHDDDRPGGSDHAIKADVQGAWKGYQELLDSAPDMQVNAIGFGERAGSSGDNGLTEEAMKTLAMFDNTATRVSGVEWNQTADGNLYYGTYGTESCKPEEEVYKEFAGTPSHSYLGPAYYALLPDGSYQELEWKWESTGFLQGEYVLGYWDEKGTWHEQNGDVYVTEKVPVSVTGGNATQVTDGESLTAVFTNGFKPGTLDGAGSDTITAAESTSSVIVFGDVMNTDQLLHDLLKDLSEDQLYGAAPLPDYGSGKEVFEWLEDPANANILVGTRFEGWTHDDSIKYMLQHAEELGCETRVDENGTTYLVTVDGTVLNLDGSEAQDVTLDSLTGRDGGDDVITGSSASDTIYGQEGNDLLVGDPSDDSEELTNVTVSNLKVMYSEQDQFENFLSRVEGTESDGDDMLFGGTGDDVLIGMGGDDYLNGGHGEDAIFGGSGDDIVVYDPSDFLVDGGQGINFMVSDTEGLSLKNILDNQDTDDGPLVNNIEVLITGQDALSLTSIDQLASDYGIKLGTDDQGQETLSLDDRWQQDGDSGTFTFTGEADLKLETVLQSVDTSSHESGDTAQHVFVLNHAND